MQDAADLRVSDADRERTAAGLREHYAAGRLTAEELEQRLQAVYAARTEGELRRPLGDLPPLSAPPPPTAIEVAATQAAVSARRAELQRQVLHRAGGGLGVFAVGTAVWLAAGARGSFWPVWILVVAAITVVRSSWNLWGPAPDLDRVEEALNRRRGARRTRDRRRR